MLLRRRFQEEGSQEDPERVVGGGSVERSDAGANEGTPQQGEQTGRKSRKAADRGKEDEGEEGGPGEGELKGMSRDFAMQHRTVALVGDSLSRQQFLSLLCLLAPRPRVLPPNHTHPVNEASEGREGGQGVAVVDVGWRFNLTWGAPVPGTARGAAVWLPGSNTTLLQRTSNLLCREEVLPAAVPVEEEGEEEEEGEDEKKEGGSKGESVEEGREEGGQGRRQVGEGRRRQYRRVVQVYEADEWLLQHLWRLDVVVLSTANHWTASRCMREGV
ncbi:unnamed protein product [Closterium sp. NIES-54]